MWWPRRLPLGITNDQRRWRVRPVTCDNELAPKWSHKSLINARQWGEIVNTWGICGAAAISKYLQLVDPSVVVKSSAYTFSSQRAMPSLLRDSLSDLLLTYFTWLNNYGFFFRSPNYTANQWKTQGRLSDKGARTRRALPQWLKNRIVPCWSSQRDIFQPKLRYTPTTNVTHASFIAKTRPLLCVVWLAIKPFFTKKESARGENLKFGKREPIKIQ